VVILLLNMADIYRYSRYTNSR